MPTDKKRAKTAKNVAGSFDGVHRHVIYERLMNAISEHRLRPGMKLAEDRLAAIYSVSRTTVRSVLQQLAHELVVTIVPNRGAFVASPTVEEARKRDDRRTAVRLSGEFHVMLAQVSGNRFIERTMRGLQMLTCLTILLYNAPTAEACPHDEHARLIDALEAGNLKLAQRVMIEHLEHIEATLRLREPEEERDDLEAILLDGP
jgi:DNA-binding GntR family transcriptional regulator